MARSGAQEGRGARDAKHESRDAKRGGRGRPEGRSGGGWKGFGGEGRGAQGGGERQGGVRNDGKGRSQRKEKRKKGLKVARGPAPDVSNSGDPHTMVIHRGRFTRAIRPLKEDLRSLLQPNTAAKLKDRRDNQMRDFVDVCGPLGVTHLLILSATEHGVNLKIAKVPQGPTISYRILKYSLMHDVLAAQAFPKFSQSMLSKPPLVVMTNFGQQEHHKLATTMFQNMFPPLNLATMKLSSCKRVLLLDYNRERDAIVLRHYSIRLPVSGTRKSIKTLLEHKAPDMGHMADISELISKSGYASESEAEDAAEGRVTLTDAFSASAAKRQRRVKLHEIGPRLELEMVKIEEGVCEGRVLFHKHVHKTFEEVAELQRKHEEKKALTAMRKKQQEANVLRKAEERKRKRPADAVQQANEGVALAEDDDHQYYVDEVGEEPDEHFGGIDGRPLKRQRRQQGHKGDSHRRGSRRGGRGMQNSQGRDGKGRGRSRGGMGGRGRLGGMASRFVGDTRRRR
ncbi:unnamed protein product [Ostreobium quekettii]|uniref:Brix domain-containing protein n=1 Tax=Ostreobium quekettii TaxID=121088 RepID=A0A8S1IYW2_9CHLO|nr:unnamed protein product [Ostreobium quekettii]